MEPETQHLVLNGVYAFVGVALGLALRWGYKFLLAYWSHNDEVVVQDSRTRAAERKEDRASLQGVIDQLYEVIAKYDKDILKLQADFETLRHEHQDCQVKMAELRMDNVNLRRGLRAMRKLRANVDVA